MKGYLAILKQCPLFAGITDDNLSSILSCVGAQVKTYEKGETILSEGSPARFLGVVLSGEAIITRTDYDGNRSIVANIEPTQIFGEVFAFAGVEAMPVDVTASVPTQVLLIAAGSMIHMCTKACDFHNQLILNLLRVVSTKNLVFHQKIEITSKRSTREKLMTYLQIQAKRSAGKAFAIPYDRQELADYLEVDRSGLSAEISKMRKEGLLDCHKNQFVLK